MFERIIGFFNKIRFTYKELMSLVLMAFLIGFIFGINDGRNTENIDSYWYNYFVSSFLVSFIIIVVFSFSAKITALILGYDSCYMLNSISVLFSLMLSLITRGYFVFFVPGGFMIEPNRKRRLGKGDEFVHNLKDKAIVNIVPIVCIILLSLISKPFTDTMIGNNMFHLSILFSLYGILPMPRSNLGLNILHYSVPLYLFLLIFVFFLSLCSLFVPILPSLFVAFIGSLILDWMLTKKLD